MWSMRAGGSEFAELEPRRYGLSGVGIRLEILIMMQKEVIKKQRAENRVLGYADVI